MKAALIALLAAVSGAVSADEVHIEWADRGAVRLVDDADMLQTLVRVVESASVDTTDHANPAAHWDEALAAQSRIHVVFQPPQLMELPQLNGAPDAALAVDEVLIALSARGWAKHIFVKTGPSYRSLAKYLPCPFAKLVLAAGFEDADREFAHLRDTLC